MQSGIVLPDEDGTLTIDNLMFLHEPYILIPYRLIIEQIPIFNRLPTGNKTVNIGEPIDQIHTFNPDTSVLEYFCKNKNEAPIFKSYIIEPSPPRENIWHTVTLNAYDPEEGKDITVLFDATTGKVIQDPKDRFRAYWWIPEKAPNYADLYIYVADSCGYGTLAILLIDIQNDD